MIKKFTILKITIAYLILHALAVAHTMGYANNNQKSIENIFLDVNLNGLRINQAFEKIENKINFTFSYRKYTLGNKKIKNMTIGRRSLGNVLRDISKTAKLNFRRVQNTIHVTRPTQGNATVIENKPYESEIVVSGTLTDENGETLPGANVRIKGTSKGTITGGDGKYTLSVPSASSVLVFSFVGFTTQEIEVGNQSQIDVSLLPDTKKLDEVVFEGFREIKANQFAGSALTISKDDLRVASETTVDKMLQGQMAGVTVENTSSVFGVAPKIRIRGSSSITGINKPLWVLDGVVLESPLNVTSSELESAGIRTVLASELGGLNPNDINTITVLKDASATALYGTRAVNGVIVVTTKRGKVNQQLGISYNGLTTVSLKHSIREFDVLNSKEQIEFHEKVYRMYSDEIHATAHRAEGAFLKLANQRNRRFITQSEYEEGVRKLKMNNTDWFDHLFHNSVNHQHNLSVSYGGEKTAGRTSFSYYKDNGYSIGQNVDRYTISTTNKYFINDKLSVESLLKYASREQRNPGSRVNPFIYAKNTSRAMRPYNDTGGYEYYKKNMVDFNIIEELNNDYADIESEETSLQINLTYQPLDNLTVTALASTKKITSQISEKQTEHSNYARSFRTKDEGAFIFNKRLLQVQRSKEIGDIIHTTVLPKGGFLENTNAKTITTTARLQADWTAYDNDVHRLKIFAGTEVVTHRTEEFRALGVGYIFSIATPYIDPRYFKSPNMHNKTYYSTRNYNKNSMSFYSSMNYNYMDKYILTLTARNDANNVASTGEKEKFLPTWVIAGAWRMSQEPFMFNLGNKISDIKLKASYGLRGNSASRGPDIVAYFRKDTGSQLSISVVEPENQDLEWEKEYVLSSGLEFTLFDKIGVIAEYYHRKNFDLVGYKFTSLSSGYRQKLINWAIMRNQGVELTFRFAPIHIGEKLTWQGSFNIGYNKNEILSNYIGNNPSIKTLSRSSGYPLKGRPLEGLYSFKFARLNSSGLPLYYNGENKEVIDIPLSNKSRGYVEYQGSRNPMYSGGINSEFRYKGFRLSTVLTFNLGHVVRKSNFYKGKVSDVMFKDDANRVADHKNRWAAYGDERFTTIPRLLDRHDRYQMELRGTDISEFLINYNRSNIRTVDASFLRVKNIMLGYDLPESILRKLKLKKINVNVQVSNIAVFASGKLRGQDPETLLSGINIPPIRTITFGLNVDI